MAMLQGLAEMAMLAEAGLTQTQQGDDDSDSDGCVVKDSSKARVNSGPPSLSNTGGLPGFGEFLRAMQQQAAQAEESNGGHGSGHPQLEAVTQLSQQLSLFGDGVDDTSGNIFQELCKNMLGDMHKQRTMTPGQREAEVRRLKLPLAGPDAAPQHNSARRFVRILEDPNAEEFLFRTGEDASASVGGTGNVVWPAAVALITFLDRMDLPQVAAGDWFSCRVVELGAGLGAVGNYLARHKGCQVVLTDVKGTLPLLERNVTVNFPHGGGPQVLHHLWGNGQELEALTEDGKFDVVVASDVTYAEEYVDDLLISVSRLLAPGGRFLVACNGRGTELSSFETAVARSELRIVAQREELPAYVAAEEAPETDDDGFEWCWVTKERLQKNSPWKQSAIVYQCLNRYERDIGPDF
eukprot:TRINITY_DN27117_c0_g1_i4.p1 TRINITY_DN27117_c0_g1~~TRINITY_DN27117_c0_g1_i4.p1  ORF type:complete len:434 (+),score=92.07 TRINITY_DN27117_c0_g1_i4:78-1304(+)